MKKISLIFIVTLTTYLNFCEIGISQEIVEWHSLSYYRASFSYPNTFGGGIFYGDFDNNNYLDILTKHFRSDGKITLFMNDGQASFRINKTINSAPYPAGATLSDFNNDNNLDFAFANSSFLNEGHRITVHLGNGDGTFQNYTTYDVHGSYTYFINSGDLNNDGYNDIVVSSAGYPDCFSVLLNDKDGTFTYKNYYNTAGQEPDNILLADLNNDQNLDVVLVCWYDYGEINIFKGNGDGTFKTAEVYMRDYGTTYKSGPIPIDIVDLDNQNGLDIVVGLSTDPMSRVYFYKMINHSDGSFSDSLVAPDYYPKKAYDWNNDGNIDILANRYNYSDSTGSTFLGVALLQNDGKGNFSDVGFVKLKVSGNFTDLNNDGKLDFAFVKGATDSIGVYLQAEGSNYPKILLVKDVPHDQGGQITLKWRASALDSNLNTLPFYSIWRALPDGVPANGSVISMNNVTAYLNGPAYRIAKLNGSNYAWEWLANQPAHRFASYTYTAATLYDSMSTTDGKHYFLVSAQSNDPNVFYDSNVDSGYSVDNLAPLSPQNLVAMYGSGSVTLHWNPCSDSDLRQYLLYRSASPDINPDVTQPFATIKDTLFIDSNPLAGNSYYLVCAQDIHDNQSPGSNEVAGTITMVDDSKNNVPSEYSLYQNHPNPFNSSIMIRYAIPMPSFVSLKIYDLLGKETARLVSKNQPAGEYEVQWNSADLPTGVYVYKLEAGDFVAVKKLILMK